MILDSPNTSHLSATLAYPMTAHSETASVVTATECSGTRSTVAMKAVILIAVTFAAYAMGVRAEFIWDDDSNIINSAALRTLSGLADIWLTPQATLQYYPLYYSILWLQYQFWADWPTGYHVVSISLHVTNALLMWRLLNEFGIRYSYAAAFIFAIHPVQAESVLWATEQKNLLSAMFAILAVLAWAPSSSEERQHYWLATILFVAGLLCKTATSPLPIVVLLLCYATNKPIDKGLLLRVATWAALAVGLSMMTVWRERATVWPDIPAYQWSLGERILIAGRAIVHYAASLLYPIGLTAIYPRWHMDYRLAVYTVIVLALPVGLIWNRHRLGRCPAAFVLMYYLMLTPILGIIKFNFLKAAFVADHFQYHASIIAIAGLVEACSRAAEKQSDHRGARVFAALLICGVLIGLTVRQAWIFRTRESYWRHAVAANPDSCIANFQLGVDLQQQGKHHEAISFYTHAVSECPWYDRAHCNLALAFADVGETELAYKRFEQALAINPTLSEAHTGLACLHHAAGQIELAERHFRLALEYTKSPADSHYNLALALAKSGQLQLAAEHLEKAIQLRPAFVAAMAELGRVLTALGQSLKAAQVLRQALQHDPQSLGAHWNLANVLAQDATTFPEAITHYQTAMRLDPQNMEIVHAMAQAQLDNGQIPEAISSFRLAYERGNGWTPAALPLAWLLATTSNSEHRDGKEALRLAQEALANEASPSVGTLDVLAAAYAETGQFDKAAEAAQLALELLPEEAPASIREALLQRQKLYQESKPYRSSGDSNR